MMIFFEKKIIYFLLPRFLLVLLRRMEEGGGLRLALAYISTMEPPFSHPRARAQLLVIHFESMTMIPFQWSGGFLTLSRA
jgi:hypothetical protein